MLALVSTAVQDHGHLALVATHAQQLDGKLLTELLQAQVLRLQQRGTTAKVMQQQRHPTWTVNRDIEGMSSDLELWLFL